MTKAKGVVCVVEKANIIFVIILHMHCDLIQCFPTVEKTVLARAWVLCKKSIKHFKIAKMSKKQTNMYMYRQSRIVGSLSNSNK